MTQTPYVLVPASTATKRKPWLLVGIPVLAVLLLAGVAAYFLWPKSLTVAGTVLLVGTFDYEGNVCAGKGGYADVREGASVIVSDGTGAKIAVGNLAAGKWIATTQCEFTFSVSAPAGKDVYGVTVGNRKGPTFTEAQVKEPLKLTLGQ